MKQKTTKKNNLIDPRNNEIELILKNIKPKKNDIIIDFSSRNSSLSQKLSKKVLPSGTIISLDYSHDSLKPIQKRSKNNNINTLVIESEEIPLVDNSIDKIISLEGIHHGDDLEKLFKEFTRILKKRGKIIIGDVENYSFIQTYLDGPVNTLSKTPYKNKFLYKKLLDKICQNNNLKIIKYKVIDVPLEFKNEDQAKNFLHKYYNSKVTPDSFFKEAKKFLGYKKLDDKFILNWQLFFLVAKKRK